MVQVHESYSTGGDALITICLWHVMPWLSPRPVAASRP